MHCFFGNHLLWGAWFSSTCICPVFHHNLFLTSLIFWVYRLQCFPPLSFCTHVIIALAPYARSHNNADTLRRFVSFFLPSLVQLSIFTSRSAHYAYMPHAQLWSASAGQDCTVVLGKTHLLNAKLEKWSFAREWKDSKYTH